MTKFEDKDLIIGSGAIPLFVQLLYSNTEKDQSLAVLALQNIAYESLEALKPLLELDMLSSNPDLMRTVDETICFMFKCPLPSFDEIKPILPVLKQLMQSNDSNVVLFSSVLLANIFERGNKDEEIQSLVDMGVIPLIFELIHHENTRIQEQVVRTISAIFKCLFWDLCQVVIDLHKLKPLLPSLSSLLTKTEDAKSKKMICYIVYSIASWNRCQLLEEVIQSGIMKHMIQLLQDCNSQSGTMEQLKNCNKIMKWIVFTINLVTQKRNHDHTRLLVRQGCIPPLCDLLASNKKGIKLAALRALEGILAVGKEEKNLGGNTGDQGRGLPYAKKIIDAGGLVKINEFRSSPLNEFTSSPHNVLAYNYDEHIRQTAINMWEDYFSQK